MRRALSLALWLLLVVCGQTARAAAEEAGTGAGDWRTEFEAVCSGTDSSLTMGDEEVKQAIARCDALLARISAEPEVVQRVFLKRLQKCRELFAYVLESRQGPAPAEPAAATGAEASPPASPQPAAPAAEGAPPPGSPEPAPYAPSPSSPAP